MSAPLSVDQLDTLKKRAFRARWKEVMSRGPDSFGLYCQHFVRIGTREGGAPIPLKWNRIQRRFAAQRRGWDIVLKARQVGFTTIELARDLWFALTRDHVRVIVVVPPHKTRENAKRIFEALGYMLDRLVECGIDVGAAWSGSTLKLANGSRLTVYDSGGTKRSAEKVGRGGTHHRVHVSELAHLEFGAEILNSLFKTVPPADRGGEFCIESTPNGAGGSFYDLWQGAIAGTNGITPHFFAWFWMPEYELRADLPDDDAPAVAADDDEVRLIAAASKAGVTLRVAQLRWWRQNVMRESLDRTLQEYPHDPTSCFLLSGAMYFSRAAVERCEALAKATPPVTSAQLATLAARLIDRPIGSFMQALSLFERRVNRGLGLFLRLWEPPAPGRYLISVDCAEGGAGDGDWLVAAIFARSTKRHVGTLRARVGPSEFARWVHELACAFGEALIVVERNGHGGTVLHVLHEELHYPHLWRDAQGRLGWWTGPTNRLPTIDDLADALEQGEFTSPDPIFASEARTFVRKKSGKVEHEDGCHDDVVLAVSIGRAVLCGPRQPQRGPRAGIVREAFG